ncbi:MAG: hypothetical protein A2X59_09965 [Nitrospirae bacterium GWC2_42_7]|nr:MAG: hypothetical protein A2X59_09965 [Nitrospirae bacterium GWC2_42_7]
MKLSKSKGFTLIEVIVVAGIIAILAGILVPMIFKEIDESKITRASADIRSISSAIFVFRKDIGQWPVMDNTCTANLTLLVGDGNVPNGAVAHGFDQTAQSSYNDHLPQDVNGCYANWKGPYIARISADPWGNAYITNAKEFSGTSDPVWIISAGPNAVIDTNNTDSQIASDDIGLRLK